MLMVAAENTRALGAVATGSMNAYEALRVVGNIRYRGLTCSPMACEGQI